MFESIDQTIMDEILSEPLEIRRTKAIAEFCDVDELTAKYYLEMHNFNPEPVVADIDRLKTMKFNTVWYITTITLVLMVIIFVAIDMLPNFLSIHGTTTWVVSYGDTTDRPEKLPVTLIVAQGMSAKEVLPYSMWHKKATEDGATKTQYCGPDHYTPNCWTNDGIDALVSTENKTKMWFRDSPGFHWGVCRTPNNTRWRCPSRWPIMCGNLKANMGVEPFCEEMETCAISIYGGPRVCPDGRDLASVYENPTSCKVSQIPDEKKDDIISLELTNEPQVFQYSTMIIILPPNETLASTREEYYVSLRAMFRTGDPEIDYGLRYAKYDIDTLQQNGIKTFSHIYNFFFEFADRTILELPRGSKSTTYVKPQLEIRADGTEDRRPALTHTLQTNNFLWYHSAIETRLETNRVTINEQVPTTSWMNGFIGPASGVVCGLLQIQSAILIMVLTGIYIPCFGGRHFFGWKINGFDEDFRTKMILYNNIYQPEFADQAEGMKILSARTVTWPSNRIVQHQEMNMLRRRESVETIENTRNNIITAMTLADADSLLPTSDSDSEHSEATKWASEPFRMKLH